MVRNGSTEEDERPAIKRRINTTDVDDDFGPIELDVPLHVDNISGAVLDGVFSGDIDHGLGDMENLDIDDYEVSDLASDVPAFPLLLDANVSPVDDASAALPTFTHGSFI
jgi:hypothetical protein